MKKLLLFVAAALLAVSASAQIQVNVTVPANTPACFFYGEMSGNTFAPMTKVTDTQYTISFPDATTIGWGYKFLWESGNWATNNSDPAGDIKEEPVGGIINVTINAWQTEPGTKYEYLSYTAWQFKYAGNGWNWEDLTSAGDNKWTATIDYTGFTGANIASDDNPIKKDWFPAGDITIDPALVDGDEAIFTMTVVSDEEVAISVSKATAADEVGADSAVKNQKIIDAVTGERYILKANGEKVNF